MDDGPDAVARRIFERWHEAVLNGDLDGLMELYAETAILGSPLIIVHHRVYWGWVGFKKVLAAGKSA